MFLEFWKRKQFRLAYDWDLVDYDEERDLIRPEFEARVRKQRLNPITGKLEPYLDAKQRYSRACFSFITVFFWVRTSDTLYFGFCCLPLALSSFILPGAFSPESMKKALKPWKFFCAVT